MVTASIYGQPVAPVEHETGSELSRIASEIAERLDEMHEIKFGAGLDFVTRLANVARVDADAYGLAVAVLHGNTDCLLESYAVQGQRAGREKQTIHYRRLQAIAHLRVVFPEAAALLDTLRLSVTHHEDPVSRADIIRENAEV